MYQTGRNRFLAALIALVMLLTVLPWNAATADRDAPSNQDTETSVSETNSGTETELEGRDDEEPAEPATEVPLGPTSPDPGDEETAKPEAAEEESPESKAGEATETEEVDSESRIVDEQWIRQGEIGPTGEGFNADGLNGPTTIPAPTIVYKPLPESSLGEMRRTRAALQADDMAPGEVRLNKTATPVSGMVNTWDIELTIEAKDQRSTSDIVLVIDRSGSMNQSGRLPAAKTAAKNFVNTLLGDAEHADTTRIAIVSYSNGVQLNSGLTNNAASLNTAINDMNATGGTHTQAGIRQAQQVLNNSTADHKHIVLLSDGVPTFSYQVNRRDNYLVPYPGYGMQIGTNVPQNDYDYGNNAGNGQTMRSWYATVGGVAHYWNHGNSAIAEAGFAKQANSIIYTVAYETYGECAEVLQNIASAGHSYQGTQENLNDILLQIAGEINAAVRNAKVNDPMGTGFTIPAGQVTDIVATPGTAVYDADTRTIRWDIGNMTQPIGNPVKTATLKYRVEIDDEILNVEEPTDGMYATNGNTQIQYQDVNDEQQTVPFPVPKVDPILLILEKILLDAAGNEIEDDDRVFTVHVTSNRGYDQYYVLKHGEKRVLTNLRLEDHYTVAETAVAGDPASSLSDYNTTIHVYGENKDNFTIRQNDPDSPVLVTNQEKALGKLTVAKVFDPVAFPTLPPVSLPDTPSFDFEVTGPNGFSKTFSLKAGETHTLEDLAYGSYSVVETGTNGFVPSYDPANGTVTLTIDEREKVVTVTNRPEEDSETVDVIGKKIWVNGAAADHVAVEMGIYQDGQRWVDAPEPSVEPASGTSDAFTYTWTNVPRYDANGKEIVYTIDELIVPQGYERTRSEDGLTVTNTYAPGTLAQVRANKVWVDGSLPRPTVWFQLFRNTPNSQAAPVPNAELKQLVSGTLVVSWSDLPEFDDAGNRYTYSVREVDADGNDFTPPCYAKSENGLTVINTYEPPKAEITATKVWVGGPVEGKPTVWFRLYRQIGNDVAVPVPQAAVQELQDGTTTVTWEGVETTDAQGRPFTFTVREVDANGNDFTPPSYTKSETGLTVTNEYQSPLSDVEARKIWIGGATPRPSVGFRLYRYLTGTQPNPETDAVSGASLKSLVGDETTVTWESMPDTDANGVPYIYYVREVHRIGDFEPGSDFDVIEGPPPNYVETYNGLTVTNEYRPPADRTFTARKVWNGGSDPKPIVWFQLQRTTDQNEWEIVDVAPQQVPTSGELTVTWEELAAADVEGNPYTYGVVEGIVDDEGNFEEAVPAHYSQYGRRTATIVNTFIPSTTDVTAEKVWVGGPEERTPITLQLYQTVEDGDPVPVGDPVVLDGIVDEPLEDGSGELEAWKYFWKQMPTTDLNGNPIAYTLVEVNPPAGYAVDVTQAPEYVFTLTNTHESENRTDVTGTKIWVGGSLPRPTVWLRLYRQIENGEPEIVPNAAIMELEDGVVSVEWTGVEIADAEGNVYTFFVREVDAEGNDFTPEGYMKAENGMTVTNREKPSVTEPPVTEPPVTEPPVTEPPVTEPPVTEPPATEPPATEPSVTDPPTMKPPATESPVTKPPATEKPKTDPVKTETPKTETPKTDSSKPGASKTEKPKTSYNPFTGDAGILAPLFLSGAALVGLAVLERQRKRK